VVHEECAMRTVVYELVQYAETLGEAPGMVGKAEVDQINIISRWIHHHSADRAFFPLPQVQGDELAYEAFVQQIWRDVESVRALPTNDEEEETEFFTSESVS
jgi:DNA polymerase III subunit epsilon